MSNRLESLNPRKPLSSSSSSSSGSKSAAKFKPKVVQRKSKEERAKVAPTIKQEPQTRQPLPNSRGRGGARGRGGRNNYAGTHMVSNGFLSAGAVSIGNSSGSKLGLTSDMIYNSNGDLSSSSTPDFIANFKSKQKASTPGAQSDEDEEDDDPTKINMTQKYRFNEEDTVLFPVRPFRDDGITRVENEITMPDVEMKQEPNDSTAESTPMPISLTQSRETTVKSELIEEKIEQIKETKSKLEKKIAQGGDSFVSEETDKIISDHQQILDILTGKLDKLSTKTEDVHPKQKQMQQDNDNDDDIDDIDVELKNEKKETYFDDQYILFQLPKHLPTYIQPKSAVKLEPGVKPIEVDEPVTEEEISKLATNNSKLRGKIGNINIHQSGKITIDLGNGIRLNVTKGAPTDFLQELALIEMNPPSKPEDNEEEDVQMVDDDGRSITGKVVRLGIVNDKIIATPCIQ